MANRIALLRGINLGATNRVSMPDLRAHLGKCRFSNCTHLHEPGCCVIDAVGDAVGDAGDGPAPITPSRYRIYTELFEELSQPPRY